MIDTDLATLYETEIKKTETEPVGYKIKRKKENT